MCKKVLQFLVSIIFSSSLFAQQIQIDPKVTTVAGTGVWGYLDGSSNVAQFGSPSGLCADPFGNIYVADYLNASIVRKISNTGVVSTFAGSGTQGFKNGTVTEANFAVPTDVLYNTNGVIYIADNGNHQIRKVQYNNVTTFVGSKEYGFQDGVGENAKFKQPYSMVYDKAGNMFVTDLFNHAIRKVTPNGTVSTVAGKGTIGYTNGSGSEVQFSSPMGIAIDSNGVLYVADYYNHVIRKVLQDGTVTTFAGTGTSGLKNGDVATAQFYKPQGIALDKKGNVYVADYGNRCIRLITPSGKVSTYIGTVEGSADGYGIYAKLTNPSDVFITNEGVMYISDNGANKILKASELNTTTSFSGTEGWDYVAQYFTISGLELKSTLNVVAPVGFEVSLSETTGFTNQLTVSPDANGNVTGLKIYFRVQKTAPAGQYNSFITINSSGAIEKKINVKAILNPKASSAIICPSYYTSTEIVGGAGYVNGHKSIAKFKLTDVNQDKSGNLFIVDRGNHCIRKMDKNGNVTTIAGDALGTAGYVDGNGLAARFNFPEKMAFDKYGNMFIADGGNHCIRKIDKQGNVTTVAGTKTSGLVDGNGSVARFNTPNGVTVDSSGNIFVTDYANSRVRKISPTGDVSTFGGINFNFPRGIDVDDSGNVYVCDQGNHQIKKLDPTGSKVLVLSGTTGGFANGESAVAKFNFPSDVSVDKEGSVYVADANNRMVRKIYKNGLTFYVGGNNNISGRTDGNTNISAFSSPFGIMVNDQGEIFVADGANYGNNSIRKLKKQELAPFVTVKSFNSTDQFYTFLAAGLSTPLTIVLPPYLEAYYNSGYNDTIVLTPANGLVNYSLQIRLSKNAPVGNFNDSITVFAKDAITLKIPIKSRVTTSASVYFDKMVSTLAGDGTSGYADGAASTAKFKGASGIVVDKKGNLYVSDFGNYVIRKISTDNVVSTFAGSGVKGFVDGLGTQASFGSMNNLAIDRSGNIYVTDFGNFAIRKITPEGYVSTIAGKGVSGTQDGTKDVATLGSIYGLAIDKDTNLYTSDAKGIRKVTQQGTVSTISTANGKANDLKFDNNGLLHLVYTYDYQQMNLGDSIPKSIAGGTNYGSADGFGGNARFYDASSIAFDKDGNLYVSDKNNYKIRKITPAGLVTTFSGTGSVGSVNGFAKTATYGTLAGIATDSIGNLYICDALNNRIRKISELVVAEMTTKENVASSAKSFKIEGLALIANVQVSAPPEFEISTTATGTYQNPFTVVPNANSAVSATLYIRLKAGLKAGKYTGNIELSTQDALTRQLPISGIVSEVTGLDDAEFAHNAIALYPNPVSTSFQLVVDEILLGMGYKIYNSSGVMVESGYLSNLNTTFDMNNQTAGVYHVVINKEGKQMIRRFVKL